MELCTRWGALAEALVASELNLEHVHARAAHDMCTGGRGEGGEADTLAEQRVEQNVQRAETPETRRTVSVCARCGSRGRGQRVGSRSGASTVCDFILPVQSLCDCMRAYMYNEFMPSFLGTARNRVVGHVWTG